MVSKKSGTTYIEFIFSLLIFTVLLIPVGFSVNNFSTTFKDQDESLLLTAIRTQINRASSESLYFLKETKIVYNKGEELEGFTFTGDLHLEFTHYGQIKQGRSVIVSKGDTMFRINIRPITGIVSLKKER